MMHGREKSGLTIVAMKPSKVAMKPSNEAGMPAEERVERRAGAKGNADDHHTLRTQGRASVDQGGPHTAGRSAVQWEGLQEEMPWSAVRAPCTAPLRSEKARENETGRIAP